MAAFPLDNVRQHIATCVAEVAQRLTDAGQWLACAESCTGGGIAEACTTISGSSNWFERGIVSYSNRAKQELLDVPPSLLDRHGAVSEAVALAMADGLRRRASVDWALSVTGVAGPTGGSPEKPVGMVCFGWAGPGVLDSVTRHFAGDRAAVRLASVEYALEGLLQRLS